MTARERYRFTCHVERLLAWQIRNAEREKAYRRRVFRRAWKQMLISIAVRIVIADNLKLYNRTKNWNI